jgi:hypothetical protein
MKLRILAFILGLPAMTLALNLTVFALTGAGFLVPGLEGVNEARMLVAFWSASGAFILLGASLDT